MISLKRILLPTDFSGFSEHAARYATEFASAFDAEVHLLTVVADVSIAVLEPGTGYPLPATYEEDMQRAAEEQLARVADSETHRDQRIVQAVRHGSPFVEILRYAQEADIDLIVMGTHGRTGLKHVLLGSVAELVVRKAPCPVLTVRHPEHDFVMP